MRPMVGGSGGAGLRERLRPVDIDRGSGGSHARSFARRVTLYGFSVADHRVFVAAAGAVPLSRNGSISTKRALATISLP